MKLSPSILTADILELKESIKTLENAGADMLHLDVMDGIFVPNISFGMPICKAIEDYPIFKDVHLMISDPLKYVNEFIDLKADLITFHLESLRYKKDVKNLISIIQDSGCACGISIKPNTPLESVLPYVKDIDVVLIMSVEPGFGGQKYMDVATDLFENDLIEYKTYDLIREDYDYSVKKDKNKDDFEIGL